MYSLSTLTNVLVFIFFSGIISFLIFQILVKKSTLFSQKKIERQINERWGDSNKSHLGGLAFSICALFTSIIIISQNTFVLGEVTQEYKSFIGIFFVIIISSIAGLIDEKENMQPLTKLFFQFILVAVLIWAGYVIPITNSYLLDVVFTIFWLVLLINALNMYDNVDGAAGFFSLIVFSLFLFIAIYEGGYTNLILLICTYIGSILIFLVYNTYPSKLFMGDIGSLQVASVLGAISIKLMWQENNSEIVYEKIYFLILNNFIFLIIFIDVFLVSIFRISQNKSPFIGDTNHLSHAVINIFSHPRLSILLLSSISLFLSLVYLIIHYLFLEISILLKLIIILLISLSLVVFVAFIYFKGINKLK